MASVTSLDKDLRNLRLSRYTPQAAAEVRDWIEEVLREKLPSGDLLEGLKDGVALCRLVNLAVSPGVKYKQSPMPFVQMENISHFLRACQMAPLSLPPHDVFLTVDLYEAKDPAQVLQCLAAFSRRANALAPGKFPRTVGPQSKRGVISPNATGSSGTGSYTRNGRAMSNASDRPETPTRASGSYSSWSKKADEGATAPAWNIHQYGYMGGASQGNQGIAFGARRQITTPGPAVPSLAEKEKRRREEEERIRQENAEREEAERTRQREREEEEARAKAEEERRWAEETARLREKERQEMEKERERWEEEKRQWEEEERRRAAEEKEAEERLEQERQRRQGASDARLNGQFLSQYQADQSRGVSASSPAETAEETPESRRIKELERELALAKEREQQYQSERQSLQSQTSNEPQPSGQSRKRPAPVPPKPSYTLSSLEQERRMLRGEWEKNQEKPAPEESADAEEEQAPPPPPRPLPEPVASPKPAVPPRELPAAPRPLPDPVAYSANRGRENRVDRFLSSNPAPQAPAPSSHRPQDYSTTSEVDAENQRRIESQQKTRAGGWASKSLLEREMERERERQREWEENQKQTQAAARDPTIGSGPGQSWDVHQYGYMGGDNQNRGGAGLGIGGARRQIIGPRPPP